MAARGVVLVRTVSRARVAKFPLMGIQPWRQQLRGLVNFKIRPKKGGVRHGGRQADYQFVQKKEQREVKRIAPAAFAEKARNLVERLAKGSEPLQDANAGLVVTRADDGLSFEIDHGGDIFSVTVDEASQTLSVLTPRTAAAAATGAGSGGHSYGLDARSGSWLSLEDDHDAVELLARELTDRCMGLANF